MLIRGLPGHPLHPPLTDATIGMYVLAAGLAIIGYAGWIELAAAKGMWLALAGGLIVSVPTAVTTGGVGRAIPALPAGQSVASPQRPSSSMCGPRCCSWSTRSALCRSSARSLAGGTARARRALSRASTSLRRSAPERVTSPGAQGARDVLLPGGGAVGSYATGRGVFRWLVTAAGLLAISGVTRLIEFWLAQGGGGIS